MPLEAFFLSYGKQDLASRASSSRASAFPARRRTCWSSGRQALQEVRQRHFGRLRRLRLRLADGIVARGARSPSAAWRHSPRAPGCEAALTGQAWTEAVVEAAAQALAQDYEPLDDLRGSAAYRRKAAANLLRRLWAERAGRSACWLDG